MVFEGDEANVFALPGGKVGVYEGMFQAVQNEERLAAVTAHETRSVVQLVSVALHQCRLCEPLQKRMPKVLETYHGNA